MIGVFRERGELDKGSLEVAVDKVGVRKDVIERMLKEVRMSSRSERATELKTAGVLDSNVHAPICSKCNVAAAAKFVRPFLTSPTCPVCFTTPMR